MVHAGFVSFFLYDLQKQRLEDSNLSFSKSDSWLKGMGFFPFGKYQTIKDKLIVKC